jgi:adenosylcobinamide kinase/adenosylcobinamide-phosphate guanylyltransferase
MPVVLVGGGSRSGKSRHALDLARRAGPRRGFLATAQALDAEMRDRIARHQAERAGAFQTIEEPLEIAAAIRAHAAGLDAIVVDCLTLWLSNLLLAGRRPDVDELLSAAGAAPCCVFVTNEVGCGVVPETELGRRFRDLAGSVNQRIAARADEVYWMAFGIPLRLK